MDIRQEFAHRLRTRRVELGLTQIQVSERMPSQPSDVRISHYESGRNLPKMEQILEFAEVLNVSPAWLCGFTSYKRDEDAEDRHFATLEDAPIPLPSGDVVMLPTDRSVQFTTETLSAHGLKPERLILLAVTDKTMAPALPEGARALVNRDQRVPTGRDMYAMLVRNKVWFRWICVELDGSFTVTAEDGDQQRETRIEATALDSLCIIGRVADISYFR